MHPQGVLLLLTLCFSVLSQGDGGKSSSAWEDEDTTPLEYDIGSTAVFEMRQVNRLVTVVFANHAYFQQKLVQNLMCSWRRLGFEGFVIVAVDHEAAAAAPTASVGLEEGSNLHWYPPYWSGVSGSVLRPTNVKTLEYVRFIHKRTRFVEALLTYTSLHVLLCDADTVWLRSPLTDGSLPFFERDCGRCDAFVVNSAHRGGDGPDRVEPLGGFIAVRNNVRAKLWYRAWTSMETCLQSKEQPAMHASLKVLNAKFARPYQYPADLDLQVLEAYQPALCVLHDAHYPTGFHMSSGYLKDYPAAHYITLGHASIPEKSGKEEWLRSHGWWFLEGDVCGGAAFAASTGGIRSPRPPAKKLRSHLKHFDIVHWTRTGPGGRDCTDEVTARLPTLRLQLEEAGRRFEMVRKGEELRSVREKRQRLSQGPQQVTWHHLLPPVLAGIFMIAGLLLWFVPARSSTDPAASAAPTHGTRPPRRRHNYHQYSSRSHTGHAIT